MTSMVEHSHTFVQPVLTSGAICIDATLGKGRDSLFFLSYPVGKVLAYEVQEALIEQAKQHIQDQRFHPFLKSHARMEEDTDKADAILFNLGYCPGDPDGISTQVQSTLQAVESACRILVPGGRMAVVCYPHEQGKAEQEALHSFLSTLDPNRFHIQTIETDKDNAPMCIQIIKQQG